ncbi:hypothetical protein B7494_g437 [Chlorociboria aeruginascens]|nr:hypothetical protein B7494_g437 [Chlorociboria aeruginascens]
MKFTISCIALTALCSLTSALPTGTDPGSGATVILHGATNDPNDQYTIVVPFGQWTATAPSDPNRLSISTVEYDHTTAACTFVGVDQATAPPVEANGGQLGPPQTIEEILCNSVGS